MSPRLAGSLLGWSGCHAVQRQPDSYPVSLSTSSSSPSSYDSYFIPLPNQYNMPTIPTHHSIKLSVGLTTGGNHSIMAGLNKELQIWSEWVGGIFMTATSVSESDISPGKCPWSSCRSFSQQSLPDHPLQLLAPSGMSCMPLLWHIYMGKVHM